MERARGVNFVSGKNGLPQKGEGISKGKVNQRGLRSQLDGGSLFRSNYWFSDNK